MGTEPVLHVFSPESECGWVLWTRGSVLSSAPSLRGRSPRCLHSHPPLVIHLSELTGLPSAGSAICYWVRRLSPNPKRRRSTGSKGNMTSSQHRRDTQRKSEPWGTTRKAKRENRKTDEFALPVPRQALPARGKHTTSTCPGPEVDSWTASLQTAQSQSAQCKAQAIKIHNQPKINNNNNKSNQIMDICLPA